MCGVIGIFGKNNPKNRAQQALEKITHRGSSTYELQYFPEAVFGANRLPIVDREFGRQPQSNEDHTIFAVQNGEIFNYHTLQQELRAKGHSFRTDSDTEVLAHLYEEYGPAMVTRLDSEMFAFIIYDKKTQAVFAARDALGVKPLYYAYDSTGQLYFASELKQLSDFEDIEVIHEFPPGTYFLNGSFTRYFDLQFTNDLQDEKKTVGILKDAIIQAVKKRVQTDLPIGVLLSGGVDSSLVMEIASRFHADVTAIILGYPGSPDREFALRLCKERDYKYHIVSPDVDFAVELDGLIYQLETYEPLIIRQSFSLDICCKAARQLGLSVVLVGEGSDELFAGYNEFFHLPTALINQGCAMLLQSLHNGHLQRVDRMSMKHTIEIRSPFFDQEILKLAMRIDGGLKIKHIDHRVTTKYILRKVAESFLPGYIAWRYKVPFSNGAGMNVGSNFKVEDGDVAHIAASRAPGKIPKSVLKKYRVYTKEGEYYLAKFFDFGYAKLHGVHKRLVVKDNLNELDTSKKPRLLVAEFDRLALYFPVYLAASIGFFDLHKLTVDFIATGGDDRTFASLVNNSAHIGLSDPMFSMFENTEGVKGEIIGELVKSAPNLAVSINPKIRITNLTDFRNYRVGTFQEFTTTHTVAKYLLPRETQIIPLDYQRLVDFLIDGKIDIAIVLPEQANDVVAAGGKIIFDFQPALPHFLFSGFTIANTLEPRYRRLLRPFIASVHEATRFILKNRKNAFTLFTDMFPDLKNPQEIFDMYIVLWSHTIRVEPQDYSEAHKVWKDLYPKLLTSYKPYFPIPSSADRVITVMNLNKYRRNFPFLEDVLHHTIEQAQKQSKPIHFFSFWGASSKKHVDTHDQETVENLTRFFDSIRKVHKPGITMTFILADEHAEGNGYAARDYTKYLKEVKILLKRKGFITIPLSKLWKKWSITHTGISTILEEKPSNWWSGVVIAKQLEEQAAKRYMQGNALRGAQKYFVMRMLEKSYLEDEFSDSIFIAFADPQQQVLFPTLPTLYLYTTKKGNSIVPWFQD